MSDTRPTSLRRYRRRIVGWGLVLLVLAFAIPAIFAVRWVHTDLENRVPDALAESGVAGVSAEFSGQDGTLDCSTPLEDPEVAVDIAEAVNGVRAIDLDASCTAGDDDSPGPETATDAETAESTATETTIATTTTTSEPASESTTSASTLPPQPELETIAELTAADPQFSQLASLLAQTGLDETLDDDGPFTLLAPTDDAFDAAFEAVGADAFEALTSDPDLLSSVLLHHAVDGAITSDSFAAGDLAMLDGTTIEIEPDAADGITFTSGDTVASAAGPTQVDIEAANGVVHAIDQVLLPADFATATAEPEPVEPVEESTTSATLINGQITLVGTVASSAQRDVLLAAAGEQLEAANVVDQLVIDDQAIVTDDDVNRLGQLVTVMPANLVSGTSTLTGDALTLTGVHLGDDANATVEALGNDIDADVTLDAREDADDDSAQELQDELNEFVTANPILFEPNSVELTADAGAIVEQVVARAQRVDGVTILIIGHTDTDGDPDLNQLISDGRANTVVQELVAGGIDQATLTSEGRGDTEPIVGDDGTEDKEASRRVEFVVQVEAAA